MASFDEYVIVHDHNIDKEFDIDDGDLKVVMKKLADIDFDSIERPIPKHISKFSMWCDTKRFIDSNYKIHKVGFLSDRKLLRVLNKQIIGDLKDISKIFNDNISYRNPFFLPIDFSHENILGGSLVSQVVVQDVDGGQDELLSLLNPCFSKIILPRETTKITPTSYAHEITHTQIVSHKGSVECYYNNEALCIYIELLHAYCEGQDCFLFDLLNRMEHAIANYYALYIYKHGDKSRLGAKYDEYSFHSDAQYLQSILIAFNLFVKTIEGTASTREKINNLIQKVFDGKITVEQFLNSVSSSYEDSKDPVFVEKMLRKIK